MSTDRELLELAAKSVGYEHCRYCEAHMAMVPENEGEDVLPFSVWNPLTDDGDALRMAVKLDIFFRPEFSVDLHYSRNEIAATRRAITRAAAEIGRGMA